MRRSLSRYIADRSDFFSLLYSAASKKVKIKSKCPSCGSKIVFYKEKKKKYNAHCTKCPATFKVDNSTGDIILYKPNKSIKVRVAHPGKPHTKNKKSIKKSKKSRREKIEVIDAKGNVLHEPGEFVCKCGPYIRGFYVARRIKDPVIPFGRIGVFRRSAQLMRTYPRRHIDPIC